MQETRHSSLSGSVCTVGQSFEGFNSGTDSSFIYHPAGRGEHARGCSKMKVLSAVYKRSVTKTYLLKVHRIVFLSKQWKA